MQRRVAVFITIQLARLVSKVFCWLPANFISKIIRWKFAKKSLGKFSSPERLRWLQNWLRKTRSSCRQKFLANFMVNTIFVGTFKKEEVNAKEKFYPPFTILISPSMRCNLSCKNCYANAYQRNEDLPFEISDRIISEGKQLGIYLYTILGGEPFLWPRLFELFQKNSDVYFQVFTNGLLINNSVIQKLIKTGNLFPVLSLEGFQGFTDEVRGKNVFEKVNKVMDNLRGEGIPFGVSICVTRDNMEEVTSDKFIDWTIEKGSVIDWFFLYMPVRAEPDLDKMPTPQQRLQLKERRDWIRKTRDDKIFIIDFWNDAPWVGGCIAGGREFLHINSQGDVEPCIFQHFAVDNIKEKSLKEVLNSQLMRAIRQRQPFDKNLYLPCMVIDHPQILREVIKLANAQPTHPGAEVIVNDGRVVNELDRYAKSVRQIYEPVLEKEVKDFS